MNIHDRFAVEIPMLCWHLRHLWDAGDIYLVGGALRDVLLHRECRDYDLITPGDPTRLARHFAEKAGGTWFSLDSVRGHSRVVCKDAKGTSCFDFAPFRGPNLEEDLRDRDFTINALAVLLRPGCDHRDIVDPCHGLADLENRFLRVCSENSFIDDPLRLLRGVRFMLQFGLDIDPVTLSLMGQAPAGLERVAGERIKGELGRIFSHGDPSRMIPLMEKTGLLANLFYGEGDEKKARAVLVETESLLAALQRKEAPGFPVDILNEVFEEGWTAATLLKLGIFLRVSCPFGCRQALGKLRFARKSLRFLDEIQTLPAKRFHEWADLNCGERGKALWVESLGRHPLEMLCVLAVLAGEDSPGRVRFILDAGGIFLRQSKEMPLPDLMPPRELMREGIEEEKIGRVLNAIRQEEISGRVTSPEEARAFVRAPGKRD